MGEAVNREADAGPTPGISVIVISVGAPRRLADAVASIVCQAENAEVLVVNSGGGDAASLLRDSGIVASTFDTERLLSPGAARNKGIASSRAPFVAFLADDCVAAPGWIKARLEAHLGGATSVGSALLNDKPRNPVAWAAHLSRFVRRLPNAPAAAALPYGASYNRSLFERYGLFREDLRTGEDTEFHRRFRPGDGPVWTAAVKTIHRTPGRLAELIRDQVGRGERYLVAKRELEGTSKLRVFFGAGKAMVQSMLYGFAWSDRRDRLFVLLSWPLFPIAALAFGVGVLSAGRKRYQ